MTSVLEKILKNNSLTNRDLVSIADLSKQEIELILDTAHNLLEKPRPNLLKGSILASCFFEPSTRTRLSFESAMLKLGGQVLGFSEPNSTSTKKGETLLDMMRAIESYADVFVLRHPLEGSARLAAEAIEKPVINAGDGANQHPSQTLLDLFTIRMCQGKIDDLHIVLAGDLKYGRTVHSLSLALAHYGVRLYFVAPTGLMLPEVITSELKKKGVKFSFHANLEEVIPKADILYMTRVQKERFAEGTIELPHPGRLLKKHLGKAKPNLRILHPLPRIDEIEESIDTTDNAFYFQQAANGIPVRMALLALLLGKL